MMGTIAATMAFAAGASVAARLTVVTTTQDLSSIAAFVGGREVAVSSIVSGARDPHRIEAKPSYMSRLAGADLFIAVGLDLEVGWERAVIEGSRNPRIRFGARGHLYAAEGVEVLDRPTGPVSRAQGDIHPHGNPHVWTDPYNARIMAGRMAERLAALDPANAAEYRSNAAEFAAAVDRGMFGAQLVQKLGSPRLWDWERAGELLDRLRSAGALGSLSGWARRMEPHRGEAIVTYHRSWTYFAHRFGLRIVAELEPKPGIDPTPGHLASVLGTVRSSGAKAILQEPYYSTRHAEWVAARTGARTVVVPLSVGQDPAAKDYFSLMDTVTARVSAALSRP